MSANPGDAAPARQSSGGGMSALTRKLGPLPVWGWMGIGLALALAYYFITKNKKSSASTAASTADTTTAASQIPQFVNQTYTTVVPPATPPPTSSTGTTSSTGSGTGTTSTGTGTTGSGTTRPTSYTATGDDSGDINRIAQSFGLTEDQLIAANPSLKKMTVTLNGKKVKLIGSGAPVPAGTKLVIPPATGARPTGTVTSPS